uniref:CS domain-containing protein n=1 Tax=Entomoneis paludosa TaxID=265537 RepID=A0A7S2YNX7_9STRA|mmetsp:Transcript_40312/g.83920  ORF Transcript_40312/g.83920 Transcript_40312/m.83920 type:complete len:224 (+) Transcript_40312:111-782(+)|eukprot:CAMPEP_0172464872 /NCGR_PEP_ID=MMETSP1065-20121228/51828_1 /TAXON_ID=265537 /ORGANISM="Amphiprora paludosa, Strain CCMP125" /LENGTH=223 /DNA_ID=CAMNT_0013221231 /DNA_START=59 /DNA_END=730 /DNA_ORIENTATION=-
MSKLSDYSKFDHLDDSDSDGEQGATAPVTAPRALPTSLPSSAVPPSSPSTGGGFVRHPQHEARFILQHEGRFIYEWEQSLNEVTLYIPTPQRIEERALEARDFVCDILPQTLRVGLQRHAGNYFLNQATGGLIDCAASTWTWEAGVLTIELQKANKGVVWETACRGGGSAPPVSLDPMQLEQERQRLLLERWQEENPGMDFRGATFNGSVPDPRTYMGGIRYD